MRARRPACVVAASGRARPRRARQLSSLPTVIEIERLAELEREVFGPVLHVLRYEREDLGGAARPDQRHRLRPDARRAHPHRRDRGARWSTPPHAGNIYVNRNVVGAVVGVQPFGGEGLSGTGPRGRRAALPAAPALGPSRRRCPRRRRRLGTRGAGADPRPADGRRARRPCPAGRCGAGRWRRQPVAAADWIAAIDRFAAHSPVGRWRSLTGPTGEEPISTPWRRARPCSASPRTTATG